MNKNESIKSLITMIIAIVLIGIGGNPVKSGVAALGCITIICLAAYVAVKTRNE